MYATGDRINKQHLGLTSHVSLGSGAHRHDRDLQPDSSTKYPFGHDSRQAHSGQAVTADYKVQHPIDYLMIYMIL